jgi:hypothetical protein
MLDFNQPVGLLAITLFHYVSPAQRPYEMIAAYRDALAPGSHLAVTHFAGDLVRAEADDLVEEMKATADSVFPRTKDEVTALFDGFDLAEPGIVPVSLWRPETPMDDSDNPSEDGLYAGVARKR